ncbi:hypothetical protein QFC21_001738 [Naganishia friedmannii]|uniref:Uncharacterized protein n=1 Tax=Naganishia friedmannii TaxID=89922 RepID=A0ACC2W0W7_9TREE|nr:hypothetical protein QFC21_001738 [Naganishia friedmannii]
MKAVIQKVTNASVTDDTPKDREYIVRKILSIRLFDAPAPIAVSEAADGDELKERQKASAWRASVKDIGGEVLCDFHGAMTTLPSSIFYNEFLNDMRTAYSAEKIQDGKFGAMMQVSLCNDGPVTIIIDSKAKPPSAPPSRSNTPLTSGTSTPALDNKKPQQTLAEKKEKRARAAEAYAERKKAEAADEQQVA